jgi:foldase protein PrsA
MMSIVYFEGVKANVRNINFKGLTIAFLAIAALTFVGCSNNPGGPGPKTNDETVATVNGKAIKMEEVERAIKAQGGDQVAKLSPLELATARLQIVQQLIQQEVLYQKAEAEKTVPTDDTIASKFSELKSGSGVSAEDFEKRMKDAGETEVTVKEGIKRQLAIDELIKKITNKVDPPKDSEIDAYYKGNPEAFIKKRGVKLAAIIIDPAKTSDDDKTTNEAEAVAKANEVLTQIKTGGDFAAIAREKSEDQQSKIQGGDLGYITEDQLKQTFPQLAPVLMDPKAPIGYMQGTRGQDGRIYILKLQERSDKDENLTLEGAGVKQNVIDLLTKGRKELLSQAYATMAMNEAKIVNYLAKKVIDNPNELTGARPASTETPNANANSNAATANSNAKANTNAPANTKPAANTAKAENKPAANTPPAANTKANTNK